MSLRALYDLPAPAKLNLFLHVVGRRADGYHLLQSPFVLIDWADVLHLERRDDGRLQRHDLGPALPADDLCLRAARLLQRESGTTLGADVSIDKRVPWGAGMGGGSSDAATVLLALDRLWGLRWPRARLLDLGARIGADVPFFVGGTNALVEGVGERLTPMALAPRWYAVVKPAAAIETAGIFGAPELVRDTEAVIVTGSLEHQASSGRLADGFGRNDLQPVAEARCPEVAQAARWLERWFGNSRMTGSGSAVFARAGMADQPVATFPAEALPPGWVGRMCRSLSRHPLADWPG
ncbi:MAG: 4-(cytidine 5'-diphospho)-2-C-methyl-D-erythritol kinase [Rubrivivax sp.]|jgi:4-diphosphocytidyl-2-C-methyl-D-erythritol kinase|nr:4-(cytidine 5'-diphospho)-2-C-methyl-D-erythritol kinase [Rubrivivax sp.]